MSPGFAAPPVIAVRVPGVTNADDEHRDGDREREVVPSNPPC